MKKYFNLTFVLLFSVFGFFVKPLNTFAVTDAQLCTSLGGECANSIACVGEQTFVTNSNGEPINCGIRSACCKTKEEFQNECELAGGKCFNNNPGSTYTPLNKTCDSGSCYKQIPAAASCASPGKCTYAPGGCPSGSTQISGTCTGVSYVCCKVTNPTPVPPINNTGYKTKDKVFCVTKNPKDGSTENSASGLIYTAIGCIPVSNTSDFIAWILRWAIGIGGGISLMLIIVASFQIMTSSGNPEKVQAGKELLTSAVAGLIMLIFSVFILKIIGIDILKLPGIN